VVDAPASPAPDNFVAIVAAFFSERAESSLQSAVSSELNEEITRISSCWIVSTCVCGSMARTFLMNCAASFIGPGQPAGGRFAVLGREGGQNAFSS
jgi:hypothetical protein